MKRSQLFILDRAMLGMMADRDIDATFRDMVELGIAGPPYPDFAIQVPAGAIMSSASDPDHSWDDLANDEAWDRSERSLLEMPIRVTYADRPPNRDMECEMFIGTMDGKRWEYVGEAVRAIDADQFKFEEFQRSSADVSAHLYRTLVVLLATRNVIHDVKHNKLAKFKLGKKPGNDFDYVTTLRVGTIHVDDHDEKREATGETRRPHLRRGHVRNQRYGPGFQYTRKVFIKPIFVNGYQNNGDDHRIAYNVGVSR